MVIAGTANYARSMVADYPDRGTVRVTILAEFTFVLQKRSYSKLFFS